LFSAVLDGRRLAPGSYRLTAVARNPAGSGSAVYAAFRVPR
jgi:hypothetical protein